MNIRHFFGSIPLESYGSADPEGRLEIFFRGYLANAAELSRRIGLDPIAERPVGDLLEASYRRFGRKLPTLLDGQFALAIADRARGEILLSHDALGVVPLYWSLKSNTLRFATKVGDLVDAEDRHGLNLPEIKRFILFGAVTDATVYSAIQRLETGTSLWCQRGLIERDVTWDPRALPTLNYHRHDDYIEHFHHVVKQSVEAALHGQNTPWIALSGGLDSNTILPPAQRCSPGLRAYSIVSPQWPVEDESPWIERIVASRGLPWQQINAEDVLPFGELPREFCGSPNTGVIHLRFRSAISELAGESVVLTGDGGDSFMGSQMGPVPSHLADPIFLGDPAGAIRGLIPWMQQSTPVRSAAHWFLHGIVLPSVRHLLHRNVRPPHYHLHPPWLRVGRLFRPGTTAPQPPSLAPRCRTPGQQALLDDLWQCAEDPAFDRTYSNRHPLFTRQVFEFLWAIPYVQKQLPRCDRYLQRRALKGLLDDDIRSRVGTGLGSRTFIEGLSRSRLWQDYLCEDPAMAGLGLVDAERWRQAIRQAAVGQTKAEPLLVRAIGVEVWLKQLAQYRPSNP